MASEFERIARIRALLSRPSEAVTLGIGDDCAVLAATPYPRVWTVDAAVENVHFSRVFMNLSDIGYRAFMAAASDVAAMGGRAVAALSALVLPADLGDADLDALVMGLGRAADSCGCPIVGGNLARGKELSLTTTVLGECRSKPLTRAGARPGDGLFVTGTVGGASLGLRALERDLGHDAQFNDAIERFLHPRARLDLAERLAAVATSAIDISDGLAQDLLHLCRASGVSAELELARVPVIDDFAARARTLALAPHALVLTGGEDYEVLFTAPPSQLASALATRIGSISEGSGEVTIFDAAGARLEVDDVLAGFDHFR